VTGHETDPVAGNDTVTRTTSAVRLADLEMVAPPTVAIGHGRSVNVDFTVLSHGPRLAMNTGATFALSAGLEVTSAGTSTGQCTVAAPRLVNCQFGILDTNLSASVRLRVTGVDVGAREIIADAFGDVTDTDQDQHARTAIEVRKVADLSLLVAANNATKTPNTPFQYTVTVRNNGPDPVGSQVDFSINGATVTSASSPIATCVTTPTVRCTLTALASGAATDILVTLNAAAAGAVAGDITVAGADADVDDPDSANNKGTLAASVTSPGGGGGSSSSSSSGGGGGRVDWLALGLLGLLLASRGRPRATARR